jgi:uncharacterized protein (DUF736 family)
MAKSNAARAMEAAHIEEEVVEGKGRKPDFLLKVRQPPTRKSDGRLYQSNNFTVIGAAWLQEAKDGTKFIGIKVNIPGMIMPDSLVLYPPFEEEKA